MKYFSVICLALLVLVTAYALNDRYTFKSEQQQQQFNALTHQLRCLVCQNETLEASNAPLANDIKDKIYQMVLAGESNQEILKYLTERYGDFIDFKPPLAPRTYLLWFAPFILLLIGGFIFYRVLRIGKSRC